MAEMRSYTIGKNKIKKGCYTGFLCEEEGSLRLCGEHTCHEIFLRKLDSVEKDCRWGRIHLEYTLPLESVCIVHVLVSNEKEFAGEKGAVPIDDFLCDATVPTEEKEKFFRQENALLFMNCRDILLYEKRGRYLWIWLQVFGAKTGKIGTIRVQNPGDHFMDTFPEIYQEEGGFFHRYLSVFSSIYQDFQEKIDHMEDWLDFDTAPAELLPIYGSWLGLDISGDFLGEAQIRRLLKEVSNLNRIKGTRACLERVLGIVWKDTAVLVERSRISEDMSGEEEVLYEMLYGKSVYDVTVLLEGEEEENLRSSLLFLLNQFKPLRARLNLVFLSESAALDSYCYLDWNARLCGTADGKLDQHRQFGQTFIL